MKEEFKKYIKKEEYNSDINKTEIWIGNFSSDPTIDPIDVICEIIRYFNYKNYNIIVDDYLSYNNRGIWDSPIIFNNITFNEEVAFMFYSFKDNISFINCTFKEDIIFGNCTFAKDISFRNCTFRANTNFWHTTFSSTSVFSESKFEGFDNNFCQSHFYGDIFCENIIVKSNINFSDSIFEENAYFKGAILGGEANFSEVKFKTNQKEINVLEYINKKQKEEIDFSIVEFETVIFKNAIFLKNVRFHKSIFKNTANFTNTKFCNLVDFYCAHFYKPQQFHFTDFLDRAIFSSTEFDEEVQFLHCTVDSNSYIRFESATFKKSLDISRSNFNDKANFWNIELEEGDAFTSPKYQNDFPEEAETESTKNTPTIYKKIRETYRIIKNNFYSQNNKIEGLKFYEKEMSAYLEENRNKKDNSENYSSKKKEVNDSLLLKKCLTNKFINRLFTLLLILLYLPFCMFIILLSPIYITAILIHKITNIDTKNTLYFIINFIFLGLYIFTKDLIWYILFAPQYIYNILYSIPNLKRSISYSIKENNYISLIILSICLVSTLVAVYGIPNQNNYILLWEGKILSFNNNILTFISYISLIIIALLFVIIFKKNEKILLWFNKNSNNFGTNWFIGLNFTTLVALITYVVISLLSSNVILQFDAEGVGNFLKGLVKIINVTEWSDITFLEQELTNWQYIFLFIGRIFVAYGYYQTIQAFRKFGKS
ncbi:pentapeptide repeat-containing protein [Capnocytophaga leadbetteri]|uniref:pentapeptide repeat-containing protein n=1 Tax=Capnocytophaga leadbetteri TaxID=327575 RepID=UPI0028EDA387|nr:pentapeptide repeat-containing protein [Capnocytophaga leadbetteri]